MQRFVNSIDLENGEDELESPAALRDWLAERELMKAGRAGRSPPICAAPSMYGRACARC